MGFEGFPITINTLVAFLLIYLVFLLFTVTNFSIISPTQRVHRTMWQSQILGEELSLGRFACADRPDQDDFCSHFSFSIRSKIRERSIRLREAIGLASWRRSDYSLVAFLSH